MGACGCAAQAQRGLWQADVDISDQATTMQPVCCTGSDVSMHAFVLTSCRTAYPAVLELQDRQLQELLQRQLRLYTTGGRGKLGVLPFEQLAHYCQ
jgi:hypothetical protein